MLAVMALSLSLWLKDTEEGQGTATCTAVQLFSPANKGNKVEEDKGPTATDGWVLDCAMMLQALLICIGINTAPSGRF